MKLSIQKEQAEPNFNNIQPSLFVSMWQTLVYIKSMNANEQPLWHML